MTGVADSFLDLPSLLGDGLTQPRGTDLMAIPLLEEEQTIGRDDDDDDAAPWPQINDAAYHGLAGKIVRAIEPHSESDPVALLIQLLASFGNAVGRSPFYQVEGDQHHANIYLVLVGETSKGRKGTAAGRVRQVMTVADQEWTSIKAGSLSSGEGLIWAVRDPVMAYERNGNGSERELVTVDHGIQDKRLYVFEPEFAGALAVMKRDGNTLSRVVRDAWDRGELGSMTKTSSARATGAHISMVRHISADELRVELDKISMANGYANRILFVCAKRSKFLPFGGALDAETIHDLGNEMKEKLTAARNIERMTMTERAQPRWRKIYPILSKGQPGLLGAILGRAEAQVIRLALIYALIDSCAQIDLCHLAAATALWDYCDGSVRYIFGDTLGDPVADTILRELSKAKEEGLTRAEIHTLLQRHQSRRRIDLALSVLEGNGRARKISRPTAGRPVEVWLWIRKGEDA